MGDFFFPLYRVRPQLLYSFQAKGPLLQILSSAGKCKSSYKPYADRWVDVLCSNRGLLKKIRQWGTGMVVHACNPTT